MTREALKDKIKKLKEKGLHTTKFESAYGLPDRTLNALMHDMSFSSKRIALVVNALKAYKKDVSKIV